MNADERFSVRIKQQVTGAWAAVSYHQSLEAARQAVHNGAAWQYVWAIFDGGKGFFCQLTRIDIPLIG